MSGYNPSVGFVLTSPDGKFTFHPGMVIDFRNMTDYRTQIPKGGGGERGHDGPSQLAFWSLRPES